MQGGRISAKLTRAAIRSGGSNSPELSLPALSARVPTSISHNLLQPASRFLSYELCDFEQHAVALCLKRILVINFIKGLEKNPEE